MLLHHCPWVASDPYLLQDSLLFGMNSYLALDPVSSIDPSSDTDIHNLADPWKTCILKKKKTRTVVRIVTGGLQLIELGICMMNRVINLELKDDRHNVKPIISSLKRANPD